jgi:hypothetical protein
MTGKTLLATALLGLLLTSCSNNGGGQAQQPPAAPPQTQQQENAYTPPATTYQTTPPVTTRTTPATSNPKKVRIEGKNYTCDELLALTCTPKFTSAFERWGDRLDSYVNSGKLGPLGNPGGDPAASLLPFEQIAYLGLYACLLNEAGGTSKDFIVDAKNAKPDADNVEWLPFWFEAERGLCSELPFKG